MPTILYLYEDSKGEQNMYQLTPCEGGWYSTNETHKSRFLGISVSPEQFETSVKFYCGYKLIEKLEV